MKKLHNIIFVLAIAFVFISCVDEDAETCNELELRFLEEPPNHSECNFVRNNCSAFPQISDFCMTANGGVDEEPVPCEDGTERAIDCGPNDRGIGREVCVNGFFKFLPGSCTDEDECIDDTTETKSCTRDGFSGEKFRACNNGKWSDFTECHICDEGNTLGCNIDSVFLVTPKRLCQPKNEYSDCTIVDFENDISGVLYYKEIGDFRGDTFTTTNDVKEFSVSFWMRFDEGTKKPIGILGIGRDESGLGYGNYLNFRAVDISCLYAEYCMTESGHHHNFVFESDVAERVQTPNEDNHIVVTMSQNHFRYYLNGKEITTITKNGALQNPKNGFDGFNSLGLPAGTKIVLSNDTFLPNCTSGQNVCDYNYSHTTIIDGILSPEDVRLLYEKGPASP